MKNIIKRIIIYICIIYFILNFTYIGIQKIIYDEIIEADETKIFYHDDTIEKMMSQEQCLDAYSHLEIINPSFKIGIFAIFIGTIIGLIKSLKENSKVKYILVFILGALVYNLGWTILQYLLIYGGLTGNYRDEFFGIYKNPSMLIIISYIIIYLISIVAIIQINKNKVSQLNKAFKENVEEKKTMKLKINVKKISIFVTTGILILVIILAVRLSYKTSILEKYVDAIDKINIEDKYQITVTKYLKDGTTEVIENYREGKGYILINRMYPSGFVTRYRCLGLALQVQISECAYNNIECYIIDDGFEKIYLQKDTALPLKYEYNDGVVNYYKLEYELK